MIWLEVHKETINMNLPNAAQFAGKPFCAPQVLGDRWDNVASMIEGKGPLGSIVAGTMDLDNLDNVVRLAYHVGIADRKNVEEILRIVGGIRPGINKVYTKGNIQHYSGYRELAESSQEAV